MGEEIAGDQQEQGGDDGDVERQGLRGPRGRLRQPTSRPGAGVIRGPPSTRCCASPSILSRRPHARSLYVPGAGGRGDAGGCGREGLQRYLPLSLRPVAPAETRLHARLPRARYMRRRGGPATRPPITPARKTAPEAAAGCRPTSPAERERRCPGRDLRAAGAFLDERVQVGDARPRLKPRRAGRPWERCRATRRRRGCRARKDQKGSVRPRGDVDAWAGATAPGWRRREAGHSRLYPQPPSPARPARQAGR